MDGKKKLEELVAGLDGVTPGPWQRVGWKPCGIYGKGGLADAPRIARIDDRAEHDRDAAHLARCDPDTIRSISDAYKAMEAECERLRALIAAGDDAHRSIVRESATPSAMKDDLVERCWTRLVGKRTTREQCNVVTIDRDDLTAILAIARPAILEEAAVAYEAHDKTDREWVNGSLWDALNREACARVASLPTDRGERDDG